MLKVQKIAIDYDGRPLLTDVNFHVGKDETICLLGPSGSGKSTILRIIAGLVKPKAGRVYWNGADLASLPPHKRSFGFMFQDYALFPHLNVFENVAFGLRVRGLGQPEVQSRVEEALEIVQLASLGERSVVDLSGGEKQRVAFARAIAPYLDAGIRLIWHCDGNLMDMVPRLLACGLGGFQGFQYEDGMDYEAICRMKDRNGGPLLIWGGVSVTKTLPHGTREDVKKEMKWLVRHAPPAGFSLAASSSVAPGTNRENIKTMMEGLKYYREHGREGGRGESEW